MPRQEWIDISMPISTHMTVWPGNDQPQLRFTRTFEEGHRSISSVVTMNVHDGTHVDAPLHFTPGGETVDQLPIDPFIGPATVVDCTGVPSVTAAVLQERVPKGPTPERLLLRTDNALRRSIEPHQFDAEFIGLTADASRWVVDHQVRLIGNDYPSIAMFKGDSETHLALMRAGVAILEGIVLDQVEPGTYELVCLPILLEGAEGSPARAVIRSI